MNVYTLSYPFIAALLLQGVIYTRAAKTETTAAKTATVGVEPAEQSTLVLTPLRTLLHLSAVTTTGVLPSSEQSLEWINNVKFRLETLQVGN